MKNLYRLFLGTAALIATLFGCTEADVEYLDIAMEEALPADFRVVAITPSSQTKVDIDGFSVTWGESDIIAIAEVGSNGEFVTSYTYSIDSESISENGKYAEFTGYELTEGRQYIAYNYHLDGYISSESSYGVTNNFFCPYGYTNFDSDNIDLILQSNIFEYDGESMPEICFDHKSTLLELDIQLLESSEYTGEITSIEISASSGGNIFLSTPVFNSYAESVYAFYDSTSQYGATSSIELILAEGAEFSSAAPIIIELPLTWNGYITEADGEFSFTIKTNDDKQSTVSKPMQVLEDGARYTAELIFDEPESIVLDDRAALIALYNAMGGDNWTNNDNWCTDADLSEWYGVYTNNYGRVVSIDLPSNGITGYIPESIGNLTSLLYLSLYSNELTGSIPAAIGDLTSLMYLYLHDNQFSGDLPESIGNLTNLKHLYLYYNQLTGSFPASIANLESILYFYAFYNNLSGEIPAAIGDWFYWPQLAWYLFQNSGYGFTSIPDVYLEPSTVTTIEGETINTQEFFGSNELTCVLFWRSWCSESTSYISTIKDLYSSYSSMGFGVISLNDETVLSTISSYVTNNSVPGHVCKISGSDYSDGTNRIKYMLTSSSPTYAFVDSEGKILFSESIYGFDDPTMSRKVATIAFMEEYFGEPSISTDIYESSDYSSDGEVITLQTASEGSGVDLVIVGDGFVDTDMTSGGVYETRMSEAMEHFFSEEPYTTLRDRFNVYTVKAVSKNSGVNGESETIFSCEFGDGTAISGSDSKVFTYALKVPSITSSSNVTVIAVLNSTNYAGTCYMYTNDAAIAYCPIVYNSDEYFRQIIVHEAGGHGFAKLLDEYAYSGTISDSVISSFSTYISMGWGANVDVTNDSDAIQWAELLADSRYSGLVGIYEGALTYQYGAYRPTDYSIMRYNTGGYNPPSRKEIYRRTMVLSGDTFDYEEFVEYDAINRSISSQTYSASQSLGVDESTFVHLASPVIRVGAPEDYK